MTNKLPSNYSISLSSTFEKSLDEVIDLEVVIL
jgi:hypothetical protein